MKSNSTNGINNKVEVPSYGSMKTIGMIGGTSWHSTIEYYRHINQLVEKRNGRPPINPPLIIYSLNVDLMRRNNWNEINQSYLEISLKLQNAGAGAILICANTPHKVYPFVAPKLAIPIIHIADAIGEEANNLNLHKLSLLGTINVTEDDFIKERLRNEHQISIETPEPTVRKEVHRLITEELTRGIFKDKTKQFFINQIAHFIQNRTDGIILGCTELPMLMKNHDLDIPLLDTTYLHAKAAVDFIFS